VTGCVAADVRRRTTNLPSLLKSSSCSCSCSSSLFCPSPPPVAADVKRRTVRDSVTYWCFLAGLGWIRLDSCFGRPDLDGIARTPDRKRVIEPSRVGRPALRSTGVLAERKKIFFLSVFFRVFPCSCVFYGHFQQKLKAASRGKREESGGLNSEFRDSRPVARGRDEKTQATKSCRSAVRSPVAPSDPCMFVAVTERVWHRFGKVVC